MLLFLKEEFTKRNKWRKEYLVEGKEERLYSTLKKEFAQLFFIIDDFTAFLELVYKSHGTESYFPITELFFKEKGLVFILLLELIPETVHQQYTHRHIKTLPMRKRESILAVS